MKTVTFGVEGMACGHCKAAVETAVKKVVGVTDAVADLDAKSLTATCNDGVSEAAIKEAVLSVGFDVID